MTTMRYGAGAQANTPIKTTTVVLGSASANGDMTLSDSLSNYQFVGIATYFSDAINSFDIYPVSFFKNPTMPIYIRYDTNNSYRHVQLAYSSDTVITISNRTNLNVQIIGIKLGGAF